MSGGAEGYLSGNRLISFPFADGQGERSAGAAPGPAGCFVDAMVYVADGDDPVVGNITSDGVTMRFDLVSGEHVTHLSVARSATVEFPVAFGSAPWGRYVLTMSSLGIREMGEVPEPICPVPAGSSSSRPEGTGLCFVPRCVVRAANPVRTVRIFDGVRPRDEGPHFVLDGDIAVKPGNNMLISNRDGTNGMVLNAIPGAGTGVVPCSCEEQAQGPKLASDDGHLRILNDTCYDIVPSTADGAIYIHAKCTACCTCQMYEEIVNGRLSELLERVVEARGLIMDRHLPEYEDAVERFNERMRTPNSDDVNLTISGVPQAPSMGSKLADGCGVTGYMDRCAFTAVVRNDSFFTLSMAVTSLSVSGSKVCDKVASWTDEFGTMHSQAVDDGTLGSFSVEAGYSLVVTFVGVREALVSRPGESQVPYVGSIGVTATYMGETVFQGTKSVTV